MYLARRLLPQELWVVRLREIASRIEAGESLSHIAAQTSIPLGVLHRMISLRHGTRRGRISSLDAMQIDTIRQRVAEGQTLRHIAETMNIPLSTLASNTKKHGISSRQRRNLHDSTDIDLAVQLYENGLIPIDEIVSKTGVRRDILYRQLRSRGRPTRHERKHVSPDYIKTSNSTEFEDEPS